MDFVFNRGRSLWHIQPSQIIAALYGRRNPSATPLSAAIARARQEEEQKQAKPAPVMEPVKDIGVEIVGNTTQDDVASETVTQPTDIGILELLSDLGGEK